MELIKNATLFERYERGEMIYDGYKIGIYVVSGAGYDVMIYDRAISHVGHVPTAADLWPLLLTSTGLEWINRGLIHSAVAAVAVLELHDRWRAATWCWVTFHLLHLRKERGSTACRVATFPYLVSIYSPIFLIRFFNRISMATNWELIGVVGVASSRVSLLPSPWLHFNQIQLHLNQLSLNDLNDWNNTKTLNFYHMSPFPHTLKRPKIT